MKATGILCIRCGKGNVLTIGCNEVVVVEIDEKLSYTLNPRENMEHLAYIEILYNNGLINTRKHPSKDKSVFTLHRGGSIYNTETEKLVSLGIVEPEKNSIRICVIDFNGSESRFMSIDDLKLMEVF